MERELPLVTVDRRPPRAWRGSGGGIKRRLGFAWVLACLAAPFWLLCSFVQSLSPWGGPLDP
jgi:hypothetical protein